MVTLTETHGRATAMNDDKDGGLTPWFYVELFAWAAMAFAMALIILPEW